MKPSTCFFVIVTYFLLSNLNKIKLISGDNKKRIYVGWFEILWENANESMPIGFPRFFFISIKGTSKLQTTKTNFQNHAKRDLLILFYRIEGNFRPFLTKLLNNFHLRLTY